MKNIEIVINGEAYPCGTLTMGALLRFERETGKNAMEVLSPASLQKGISFTDLGTLMWSCTASATRAEGKKFDIDCLDFLDNCPPDVAERWLTEALMKQTEDGETKTDTDEKKSLTQ